MGLFVYLMRGLKNKEKKMKLKEKILTGEFKEAHKIIDDIGINTIKDKLLDIAYDKESIEVYFFVLTLIEKHETSEMHYLASKVLSTALCHTKGAYNAALYHARKSIQLAPEDISYKEYLLLFYNIPEKLISDNEALKISQKILSVNPDNKIAQEIMDKITK